MYKEYIILIIVLQGGLCQVTGMAQKGLLLMEGIDSGLVLQRMVEDPMGETLGEPLLLLTPTPHNLNSHPSLIQVRFVFKCFLIDYWENNLLFL
jgi:hypothetical protein